MLLRLAACGLLVMSLGTAACAKHRGCRLDLLEPSGAATSPAAARVAGDAPAPAAAAPRPGQRTAARHAGDSAYHMDGGIREQVFIRDVVLKRLGEGHDQRMASFRTAASVLGGPPVVDPSAALPAVSFVINGYLGVHAHCTQPGLVDIALRSSDILTSEAILGTLWKAWGELKLGEPACDRARFRVVSIPDAALPRAPNSEPKGSLDYTRADVRALLQAGRAVADTPDPWITDPNELPDTLMVRECSVPGK